MVLSQLKIVGFYHWFEVMLALLWGDVIHVVTCPGLECVTEPTVHVYVASYRQVYMSH